MYSKTKSEAHIRSARAAAGGGSDRGEHLFPDNDGLDLKDRVRVAAQSRALLRALTGVAV